MQKDGSNNERLFEDGYQITNQLLIKVLTSNVFVIRC